MIDVAVEEMFNLDDAGERAKAEEFFGHRRFRRAMNARLARQTAMMVAGFRILKVKSKVHDGDIFSIHGEDLAYPSLDEAIEAAKHIFHHRLSKKHLG